jgi:pimeloyl-ACP methyl ester carboxylesterase
LETNNQIPKLSIKGQGNPFIWLHGMLSSVDSDSIYSLIDFDKLSDLVSLVRYDYCDKSIEGNYAWPALAEELLRVADSQNYDRLILGGLSMGSGIILHLATQFPERAKALILVTPPPAWEMRSETKKVYKKIVSQTNKNSIPEILKRIIQWNQDPPEFYERMYPGTRQKLIENRLNFEPQYYTQIYSGGAESDFPSREQIAQINVPTLIVTIPDDLNHPFEMAQELNMLIKSSELFVISDFTSYQNLQNKVHDFIADLSFDNKS